MKKHAVFSDCGNFRYRLWREWGLGSPLLFVMLNPSTADAFTVDPTIRRCIGFARRWGAGGITVVNLYGLRSTDPRALNVHPDPVGPDNDAVIGRVLSGDGIARVVAAWGAHGRADRVATVRALAAGAGVSLACLGRTKGCSPRHPLYVRGDADLLPLEATP